MNTNDREFEAELAELEAERQKHDEIKFPIWFEDLRAELGGVSDVHLPAEPEARRFYMLRISPAEAASAIMAGFEPEDLKLELADLAARMAEGWAGAIEAEDLAGGIRQDERDRELELAGLVDDRPVESCERCRLQLCETCEWFGARRGDIAAEVAARAQALGPDDLLIREAQAEAQIADLGFRLRADREPASKGYSLAEDRRRQREAERLAAETELIVRCCEANRIDLVPAHLRG